MRLIMKLGVLVMFTVVAQALISRYEGEIDEARFAARCWVAFLNGRDAADPELGDAALALLDRQRKRVGLSVLAVAALPGEPATRPVVAAVTDGAGDAMEEWLACSAPSDPSQP